MKQLRFERIKDYLLLEEEFIKNQERLKPQEDRHEVKIDFIEIKINLNEIFYRKNVQKLMIFGMLDFSSQELINFILIVFQRITNGCGYFRGNN